MEKVITVHGKSFKVVKSGNQGVCFCCSAKEYTYDCDSYRKHNNGDAMGLSLRKSQYTHLSALPPLANHNATRLNALMDTLQRYAEAGSPTKVQWVQEVKSLIEYERNLTREALDKVPFKL